MLSSRWVSNSILVGIFDESFKSRIHVSLHLSGFDAVQRSMVWDQLLWALERDYKGLRIDSSAREYLKDNVVLQKLQWNGKEMQNGRPFDSRRSVYVWADRALQPFRRPLLSLKKTLQSIHVSIVCKTYALPKR